MSDANFTPNLGEYKSLQPFRFWCQKVLPLVYDDSLSYYELLCKIVDYLNKAMEDVETLHDDVTGLHDAYVKLQWYVNNYFNNLDVQVEINNKLDAMASDGSLTVLIKKYIDPYINEQNSKITVLENRMNTFTSLPSGSTSGDAELLDIRVPASGFNNNMNYPTAGDSVRGQVSQLNDTIHSLIISSPNIFNKKILQTGFYSTAYDDVHISENADFLCLLVDVLPNTEYSMTGWGYTSSFYDVNGLRDKIHKVGTNKASNENITFTTPNTAIKMSINIDLRTNNPDTFMLIKGGVIPDVYYPFKNELAYSPYITEKDIEGVVTSKKYYVGNDKEFTTLMGCLKALKNDNHNKIIYIDGGTYDIFSEIGGTNFLSTIKESDTWRDVSIIVPPNTTIIGVGKVILEYLPKGSDIPSDNAVSCISPINVSGNTRLENITILAKNCRYCIHDETSGLSEFDGNTKYFKNIICHKYANDYVPTKKVISGQSYAAGLSKRCSLYFENCHFKSDNSISWSVHNRTFGDGDGVLINLNSCIFEGGAPSYGTIRFGNASKYKSHSNVHISGCYLNGALSIHDESTGPYYNTYDIELLNTTNIEFMEQYSKINEYPIKVFNAI